MEIAEATKMVITVVKSLDEDGVRAVEAALIERCDQLGIATKMPSIKPVSSEPTAEVSTRSPAPKRRKVEPTASWTADWWRLIGGYDDGLAKAGKGLYAVIGTFFNTKRLGEIVGLVPIGTLFLAKMVSTAGIDIRLYMKWSDSELKLVTSTLTMRKVEEDTGKKMWTPPYPSGHPALSIMETLALYVERGIVETKMVPSLFSKEKKDGAIMQVAGSLSEAKSLAVGWSGQVLTIPSASAKEGEDKAFDRGEKADDEEEAIY